MPKPNNSNLSISETTGIPVKGPLASMGAIAYFAVLAYPSRAEWPKRDKFVKGAKAWLLWRATKRGYPKKRIKAEYRNEWRKKGGPRKFDAVADRAFDRILKRRFPAAQMLLWNCFHGFKINLQFDSPKGVRLKTLTVELRYKGLPNQKRKRFNSYKAAEYLTGNSDSGNMRRLVWRESLPVLHLALALESEMYRAEKSPLNHLKLHPLDYLILDPSWLPRTLSQAEMLRLLMMKYFPKVGRGLIQLLPTP